MARNPDNTFDVIVLGVGGMGSAACLELATRGTKVLGLEQFPLVHDRGSSHGDTRIIRKAYFEHPDYVPLLHRAYDLWHELERDTKRELLLQTGLILSGPPEGETIRGARLSATTHHLQLENLTAAQATRRFPGFNFPAGHEVVYEPIAGTLLVEDCVRASIELARQRGAVIHEQEPVEGWSSEGSSIVVRTRSAEYYSRSLVITAGAWSTRLLRDLNLPIRVLRKFVGWFPCDNPDLRADRGCPTFLFELPHGAFYGFPSFDQRLVKVAEHTGGDVVEHLERIDRQCNPADLVPLNEFSSRYLGRVSSTPQRHSVCLYSMSPDGHFIVDHHPTYRNVVFAAGFSGHGFKFCPVIGEALTDLVLNGMTRLPIEFLSRSRFATPS